MLGGPRPRRCDVRGRRRGRRWTGRVCGSSEGRAGGVARMSLDWEARPWGSWHVIDEGDGYKVKRIHVAPGQRLSYQTHEHRSEHWVVIAGTATCVVDGETVVAEAGRSV